ncbi:MAG: hypothetical protein IPJ74_24925 [Saprospiraceae bacterium]|nr:hypothetical protein [Saprospiraceae bacterium]
MNGAIFDQSMLSIEKLLKDIKFHGDVSLLKQRTTKKINKDGLSNEFKSIFQTNDYFRVYIVGKENYDFDFLLQDESYLQFSIFQNSDNSPPELRYAFFQNPQYFITWMIPGRDFKNFDPETGRSFIQEFYGARWGSSDWNKIEFIVRFQ